MLKHEPIRYWLYHNLPMAAGKQRDRILRQQVGGDIKTLLDVGCGMGYLKVFGEHYSIGVDIHRESLEISSKTGRYKGLIQCDVRRIPFANKSFDGVICSEVIEHLPKEDGDVLIDSIENIARKLVIITTPWGADLLERYSFNPYMQHISGWLPQEFKKRGYKIIPLKTLRYLKFGDYYWYSTMLHYGFTLLLSLLVVMLPYEFSDNFVAVKYLEE